MGMLHLLIVTQGDAVQLNQTLSSLEGSRLPANLAFVCVVDNGKRPHCRSMAALRRPDFDVLYQFLPGLSKAQAMNVALEAIPDESLIVVSSDEIRFHSETLLAYQQASRTAAPGEFFGGPFQCDYELQPPPWVIPYMPLASTGWQPTKDQIEPTRTRFFGFNWAAFCHDIKRLGGFGLRPESVPAIGSMRRQAGIQRRMLASGMRGRYVPESIVSRFIPQNRCTVDWTVDHARQDGIHRGISRRDCAVADIALHHWSNTVGLFASTAVKWVTGPRWANQLHFRARCRQQQSIGYFHGFRGGVDASTFRKAS